MRVIPTAVLVVVVFCLSFFISRQLVRRTLRTPVTEPSEPFTNGQTIAVVALPPRSRDSAAAEAPATTASSSPLIGDQISHTTGVLPTNEPTSERASSAAVDQPRPSDGLRASSVTTIRFDPMTLVGDRHLRSTRWTTIGKTAEVRRGWTCFPPGEPNRTSCGVVMVALLQPLAQPGVTLDEQQLADHVVSQLRQFQRTEFLFGFPVFVVTTSTRVASAIDPQVRALGAGVTVLLLDTSPSHANVSHTTLPPVLVGLLHTPFERSVVLDASTVSVTESRAHGPPTVWFPLLDFFDLLLMPAPQWELATVDSAVDMRFNHRLVLANQNARVAAFVDTWRWLHLAAVGTPPAGARVEENPFFAGPGTHRCTSCLMTTAVRETTVRATAIDPMMCIDDSGLLDVCALQRRRKLRREGPSSRCDLVGGVSVVAK